MPLFPNKSEKEVKKSFLRVKEDIKSINFTLNNQNRIISEILERLDRIEMELKLYFPYFPEKERKSNYFFHVPSEAKGSKQSINQSTSNQSLSNHAPKNQIKKDFDGILSPFYKLPQQKLLTFLEIYTLGEEKGTVTYHDLASKMGLSESCIRGYISDMIRFGLPILIKHINNTTSCLLIPEDFRALGLKKKLEDIYYNKDPKQRRLFDNY